jgi:hypothetical protein
MTVREGDRTEMNDFVADLQGLEIPGYWLEQRTGSRTPTAPVDLSYLEYVAALIIDPTPTPYATWFPVFTSLYTTISHSRHEGAHKLWIAFLRKGMASLNYLIRTTTPETIAAEVANLVQRKNTYIMRTPEVHRSAAYWYTLSDAHRWYCNLERMLAGDAGLTQDLITELGEGMIEIVGKPFEKISSVISIGDPEISNTTENVLRDIEDARAVMAKADSLDTTEKVRARILSIMKELQTIPAK